MALFRLLHFPSAHQILPSSLPLYKLPQTNSPISLPSVSLNIPFETQRLNVYRFHTSLSTRAQPATQTSEHQQSPVLEEEEEEEEEEEGQEAVEEEFSKTRLLAQNVPWTSTANDLRPLFEKYGNVLDIELSMYNKTRNRGLAFVTMGSHEEALAALNSLEAHEFEGRVLKLTWAKPKMSKPTTPSKPKPMPVHNLFVANLPFQARANDLKEFFNADNANVISTEVIFHENPRRSLGYGFIAFNTKEEADAALSAFQGKEFMGRPIRLAHSKRFLRQQTKADLLSDNASAISNSLEESEKPAESEN